MASHALSTRNSRQGSVAWLHHEPWQPSAPKPPPSSRAESEATQGCLSHGLSCAIMSCDAVPLVLCASRASHLTLQVCHPHATAFDVFYPSRRRRGHRPHREKLAAVLRDLRHLIPSASMRGGRWGKTPAPSRALGAQSRPSQVRSECPMHCLPGQASGRHIEPLDTSEQGRARRRSISVLRHESAEIGILEIPSAQPSATPPSLSLLSSKKPPRSLRPRRRFASHPLPSSSYSAAHSRSEAASPSCPTPCRTRLPSCDRHFSVHPSPRSSSSTPQSATSHCWPSSRHRPARRDCFATCPPRPFCRGTEPRTLGRAGSKAHS